MTLEEVLREITATKIRLNRLKSELRVIRSLEKLRTGKTVSSQIYQILEALPYDAPTCTPVQIMKQLVDRHGLPPTTQRYAVDSALRSMRVMGTVVKTDWATYAAASRLAPDTAVKARAANV